MICKICKNKSNKIFTKKVFGKYDISYYKCLNCEFIQTEDPFWLEDAYSNPINISDTGLLKRNIFLSKITALIIILYFNRKKIFVDFAGGYGVFVRLMRDIGFNFFWSDLFTENIFSKGFEWDKKKEKKVEMITTFESFEHFEDPLKEVQKMLDISDNILFSTEIIPSKNIEEWWYLGVHHGQHISFYSEKTLKIISDKFDLRLYTNNKNIHLFTRSNKKVNFKLVTFLSKIRIGLIIFKIMHSKTIEDSDKVRTQDFL
ncbi:MAG: class I SAM-dependent methyltransferase [Candidatus Shapirobacteria bacterium]|nr:class I SAM-dependent methyltransferase [Candidatus Shapirobacteria bacterium]